MLSGRPESPPPRSRLGGPAAGEVGRRAGTAGDRGERGSNAGEGPPDSSLRPAAGVGTVGAVRYAIWVGILGAIGLIACSSAPEQARKNRTFYDWATATGAGSGDFEQPYPPLDLAATPPQVRYKGVTVVRGGVHLSRPFNWMLRDGDNAPGQAFVQYISPNAYVFSIYERPESPTELWRDVMQRFEDDTQSLGAKIAGSRVPMATQIGQGRAYTIERQVEASKAPLVSKSREYLVRGETRIVLVQIVHEGDDLSAIDQELKRVVETLEVL